MKHILFFSVLILLCVSLLNSASASAETFGNALISGKFGVDFRYRLEEVEQANLVEEARASTLRTRLGYRTKKYHGIEFYAEADDVSNIGADDYLTPSAGPVATTVGPKAAGRPVIADPLETELNQLYVSISNEENKAVLGRQRLIRGNSRFVGNVGWRQHEQTYDGVSLENKSLQGINVFAAYLKKRNTITFTDIDLDTVLLDIQFDNVPFGALSAYYYDIQIDDVPTKWENLGLRYAGKHSGFSYALEYARQENAAGENPNYSLLEAGYDFGRVSIGGGVESLGSDNGTSFATPLATLHKFNGWADQFLATPAQGLQDRYLKIGATIANVKLLAVKHDYESDEASRDFGEEINVVATSKIAKHFTVGAKYADYSAGDVQTNKVDVEKFWFWVAAKF